MKNTVKIESWMVNRDNKKVAVQKIAVRNKKGQFHGATNFRGSVISK